MALRDWPVNLQEVPHNLLTQRRPNFPTRDGAFGEDWRWLLAEPAAPAPPHLVSRAWYAPGLVNPPSRGVRLVAISLTATRTHPFLFLAPP